MRILHRVICAGLIVAGAACAASDPGITTAVKAKLAADNEVKAYQIDVDTDGGVVTLSGAVPTQAAKDRAVQLARETDGVTNVNDQLRVDPSMTAGGQTGGDRAQGAADSASDKASEAAEKVGEAAKATGEAAAAAAKEAAPVVADAGITAAVKTRLLADPDVAGLRIDVDTRDKVVTLTGNVKTAAQIAEAEKIARETPGVARVVNNLKVGT